MNKIKKAQSLSLQTVVIAVLVLLVMIVLMVIFSSKSQPVANLYSKCEGDLHGRMIDADKDCAEETKDDSDGIQKPYTHPLYKEEKDGKLIKKCCVANFV